MTPALDAVHIHDFQSLSDVRLALHPAVTVIVGPNDAGKSAILRAISAALYNRAGGAFVRRGRPACSVELRFGDATLVWEKPSKGGARYTLTAGDGAVLEATRAEAEMTPEIEAVTGVRELRGDGIRARLNVIDQFADTFLLADTGGQAARLLALVSHLDRLVTAQVEAKRDMVEAQRAEKDAAERAGALRVELDAMPDYDALLAEWGRLVERGAVLDTETEAQARATALTAERDGLAAVTERWAGLRLPERAGEMAAEADALACAAERFHLLESARHECQRIGGLLVEAGVRLAEAEMEMEQTMAALRICPVCQRPMAGA